jgi:cytochrome c oxidase subunit 2
LGWGILALLAIVILIAPLPAGAKTPGERIVRIDASRFAYDPAVIRVNQGDRVTIELVSDDVVHGLSIDGYGVEATADPGAPAKVSFVADQAGSFRFRCTTTCGNLHPFMIGKLEVGQNLLLWRGIALTGLVLLAGIWRARP